jgi:hypothetical protein
MYWQRLTTELVRPMSSVHRVIYFTLTGSVDEKKHLAKPSKPDAELAKGLEYVKAGPFNLETTYGTAFANVKAVLAKVKTEALPKLLKSMETAKEPDVSHVAR